MAHVSCLAGIAIDSESALLGVLERLEIPVLAGNARLDVGRIGKLAPELLLCDIDAVPVDPLEFLRQLRFVLPACVLAVYTERLSRSWAVSCHLAGASCVLSKLSTPAQLLSGLRDAMLSGCYTDPRFADA